MSQIILRLPNPTPEVFLKFFPVVENFNQNNRGARKIELKQARSKPDPVNQPVRTAHTFVHHYNGAQYCSTETVLLIFPFLQTIIISQMWPSGCKGAPSDSYIPVVCVCLCVDVWQLQPDFRSALFNVALLIANDLHQPLQAVPYLKQLLQVWRKVRLMSAY